MVGDDNFAKFCEQYTKLELQSKFEVISFTDGDFRAVGVPLDGIRLQTCS